MTAADADTRQTTKNSSTENRSPPRVPVAQQQLRVATPYLFHPRGRLLVRQCEPGPQPVQ